MFHNIEVALRPFHKLAIALRSCLERAAPNRFVCLPCGLGQRYFGRPALHAVAL